jgi:hypothetical protein
MTTENELRSLEAGAADATSPRGGRRRFLIGAATAGVAAAGVRVGSVWAADGGAAVVVGDVGDGGPSDVTDGDPGDVTVWRLAGSETLTCRACAAHSAHKVFFDHSAALWGRAHVGCRCEPESFTVSADEAAALAARSRDDGRSVDRRWLG